MSFITKLNLQDNRQHRLPKRQKHILSGTTEFGVTFSALTSGPDLSTIVEGDDIASGVTGTFSGNSSEVIFNVTSYGMDMFMTFPPLTSANSGQTFNSDNVFNPIGINPQVIDDNTVYLNYTGLTFDFSLTSFSGDPMSTYVGDIIIDDGYYLSAGTLDFTGRTIWSDVKGIHRTEDIIITKNANLGYVLTSDAEGKGIWQSPTGGGGGGTFTGNTSGTCINDIHVANIHGCDVVTLHSSIQHTGSTASGLLSTAFGEWTEASGVYSHAQGYYTEASGDYSHAQGGITYATGIASHAQGGSTRAAGDYSHAQGHNTRAIGMFSHAQGVNTMASGEASHAQGVSTKASGYTSHAGGSQTVASGETSFVHFRNDTGTPMGAMAHYSAILGGVDHNIEINANNSAILGGSGNTITSNASGSVILGGSGITAASADAVYVPDLIIDGLTGVTTLATDTSGKIIDATTSDRRLKQNIQPLSDSINKINQLRGVSFEYTEESNMGAGLRYGFIAQEVQNVIPNMVRSRAKGGGMLSLNYNEIIPWLVEAVKDIVNGTSSISNILYETQTILSEDNNIDLNFNGTYESALGGGISVKNSIVGGGDSFIKVDESGKWVVGPSLTTPQLTLPKYTPTSTQDGQGDVGDVVWDDTYVYIKTNNGWGRSNLETF